MAFFLFFQNLVNSKEDAAFLDIAELVVDRRAEHAHGRRQAHVGIDQRRDVKPLFAYCGIQDFVIFLEVAAGEHSRELREV